MKNNYLKIKVHIYKDANWFKESRKKLFDLGKQVKWQRKGTFHQTLVFIYDDTCVKEMKKSFSEMVKKHKPFTLAINKLDAFLAGEEYIIYLTSTQHSAEMKALADDARALVKDMGGNTDDREFKPHITLGRIPANAISLTDLKSILSTIKLREFKCQLNQVEYVYKKEKRGERERLIGKWEL